MPRKNAPDDASRPPLPAGTSYGKGGKPLSPRERLENINNALFENELLEETEFDAADAERAKAIIQSAIKRSKANQPTLPQKASTPGQTPEKERSWAKKSAAKKQIERGGDRQRD